MIQTPVQTAATAGIGRRWRAVRGVLLALAVLCSAAAVALHPAAAARYLSDDGVLAPSSERALSVAAAVLLSTALLVLLAWRRWRTPTPRRERIALGCAAIAGSVLISAAGAEAGLSIVHHFVKPLGAERHYFFAYDPVLGWKHRPGSVATFKNTLVRIDAGGLRVSGRERGSFRSRVLLLGDSQAFGDGVAAEETFAARLEANMPDVRVLNASVIGYGTDQQLLYFEQHGRRHAPEIIVVALNAYDLRDNLSTRVRSGYAKPRFVATPAGLTLTNSPVPGGGLADRLHTGLQYHSRLYGLVSRMRRSAGRQSDDATENLSSGLRLAKEVYPDDAHLDRGLAVTAAILDRLAQRAAETGSRVIVLFLPYQMDFAGLDAYTQHTERLVHSLAQQANGRYTFVDGRRALAGHHPERMFRDAMHLTPEGHQQVAAALEQALVAEKLISRADEH